jgi:hypothetical protein
VSAFGQLLAGDADATLATLLDVDVERSPFALAARATAHAALGDHRAALADVMAVESMSSVSSWDLVVARVAGAASATGDEADQRCDGLARRIDELEDVVVSSYASEVLKRLGREPARANDDSSPPPGGWADLAVALVPAG